MSFPADCWSGHRHDSAMAEPVAWSWSGIPILAYEARRSLARRYSAV
jgi:hypothetical protein